MIIVMQNILTILSFGLQKAMFSGERENTHPSKILGQAQPPCEVDVMM